MDRIKFSCLFSGEMSEVQLDVKKIPGEKGLCYMVSRDGLFKGYIKKEMSGSFERLTNSELSDEEISGINIHLSTLKFTKDLL